MNSEKVSEEVSEEKVISFKTDKELKELAKKACMNKLFIADNVHNKDKMIAFQCVLALAKPEQIPKNVGAIYAEYDNREYPTSGLCINGYPNFFACSFLTVEEYLKFIDFYKELNEIFNSY